VGLTLATLQQFWLHAPSDVTIVIKTGLYTTVIKSKLIYIPHLKVTRKHWRECKSPSDCHLEFGWIEHHIKLLLIAQFGKAQISLSQLPHDVCNKPVTSPLAQISLCQLPRNFPRQGSFGEVGIMEFGLKGMSWVCREHHGEVTMVEFGLKDISNHSWAITMWNQYGGFDLELWPWRLKS